MARYRFKGQDEGGVEAFRFTPVATLPDWFDDAVLAGAISTDEFGTTYMHNEDGNKSPIPFGYWVIKLDSGRITKCDDETFTPRYTLIEE